MIPTCKILIGDVREKLRELPAESVNVCVTSPPYWGLRDYGVDGQIGHERTPADFVAVMVEVFREVRRVLRPDGTLWLNLGDTYCTGDGYKKKPIGTRNLHPVQRHNKSSDFQAPPARQPQAGLKSKDLVGIPWRVALALQADGWWLRSEITWIKLACMPESTPDRPTNATEKIFLLSKSKKYFYDAAAVREPKAAATLSDRRTNADGVRRDRNFPGQASNGGTKLGDESELRNMRNYWILAPEPYQDAHFATFPTAIPRRAILAGSPGGGLVLDPFGGSGTTGAVALEYGRNAVLIDLNPLNERLMRERCAPFEGQGVML